LAQVLRRLPAPDHPDLIVGTETADDAAVWRRPDGRALVATADFFAPIVDDARTWGRIAAVNAASDVYAMGGRPLFGLNLVAWPRELLPLHLLGEVLAGGAEAARAGTWVVAGGHSVDGPEPMYGQSLVGELDGPPLTNAGARPGDRLVLTKPLGTGLLATAVKRLEPAAVAAGGILAAVYSAGVAEMIRLNDTAADAARAAGAHAATDVTGFGLLGHLLELVSASGVGAELDAPAVPLLPGVIDLAEQGFVAGGTERNVAHVGPRVTGATGSTLTVLADAQTSGGLLIAVPAPAAAGLVARLVDSGHRAAVIGEMVAAPTGFINVTGRL
jgi:selenide, water dikinase